jgi:hypothetical protein
VAVIVALVVFPAASLAVTMNKLVPTSAGGLQRNVDDSRTADWPLHEIDATPDIGSVALPVISIGDVNAPPPVGDVILRSGGVRSRFSTGLVTVAELPDLSVAESVILCPAPSVEIVWSLGQLAMPDPVSVQVKCTVIGTFSQPFAFGAGVNATVIVGLA